MHDHSHWPGTLTAFALSGLWATLAEMPWATVFSLGGIILTALGLPALKLLKQYQLDRLEIEARRRELEARARG